MKMGRFFLRVVLYSALFLIPVLTAGCNDGGWSLPLFGIGDSQSEGLSLPSAEGNRKGIEGENPDDLYILYYPDVDNRFLVPVTRNITPTETIARSVIEKLIATSKDDPELSKARLYPPIPPNTIVRGLVVEDGLATLNLSASFLTYPPEAERLVLGSICSSLWQFENVKRVQITVEGVKIDEFPGGAPGQEPFDREDMMINLEIDDDVADYRDSTALTVYFAHAGTGRIFYVPVTRVLSGPPIEAPAKASLEELLSGPRHRIGLYSDIPAATRLLGFEIEDGMAIVNLSGEFTGYRGGKSGEENMLNLIVLTLTACEAIDEVKILVDGEEITLPDGADLSLPLSRPEWINCL